MRPPSRPTFAEWLVAYGTDPRAMWMHRGVGIGILSGVWLALWLKRQPIGVLALGAAVLWSVVQFTLVVMMYRHDRRRGERAADDHDDDRAR
jgi:hypothetical protein